MKKFFAILLSAMLMLSLAVPASAASITIEKGASDSEYAAYKLLNAAKPTDNDTSGTYNFSVNSKYLDALQTVTQKTEEADIIEYIAGLTDADDVRDFADAVYAEIKELTPDEKTTDDEADTTDVDESKTLAVFEKVEMGYYLIAETKVGDSSDTFSLIMLDTAAANADENIKVSTKEDKPTVDKEVEEKNDTTGVSGFWGESADYDIGDEINYRITGTVSSKYADYASYWYSFEDTMDDGLSLKTDAAEGESADYTDSIKVTVNGIDITGSFAITAEAHKFIATANLKSITTGKDVDGKDVTVAIEAEDEIIVTYTAILNENAVSGEKGNENKVVLKYENDPYTSENHTPTTPGETPEDVNIVFTYDAIVNKTDEESDALEGAGFTLYKWVKNGVDSTNEETGENTKVDGWVVIKTITGETTFTFEGLDVGKYKLEETTVPNGYNKAADIEFEVVATYDKTKDPVELTGLEVKDKTGNVISGENMTFTADKTDGEVETDVVNKAGVALPSTGGMGTTIFYIVGGIMVVGAVVLLVTKKRMSAEG